MALEAMKNPAHGDALARARDYIKGCQQETGGMGYDATSRADLSNTALALEALRELGLSEEDPAFRRAAAFVTTCQNDNEHNEEAWAGADGGFIYRPGETKADSYEDEAGQTRHQSYGLMSYAGLVSFLWAGVDRDDPRVRSAFRWVEENWTLEENRNLGDAGLFYYYLTMAKALQVYGQRIIETSDGARHDWPAELAERIMSRQREDGSWANENRRWYEDDPILVTAYMVRTLSICHEVIHEGGRE
jgi:squalene-hopene/tetraprenyl-beta-curcumene cyclase